MKPNKTNGAAWKSILAAIGICAAAGVLFSAPQAKTPAPPAGKAFASPREAADAMIAAASTADIPAILDILGPDAKDLVASEDPVGDKKRLSDFANLAKERVAVKKTKTGMAELSVGAEDWPFPIPIVRRTGKWYFDVAAGREEILLRRIGQNELDAIKICRGFVDAQHEYSLEQHDNSKLNQYAQRIISSPGKHDGLAWQNSDGTWGGPVGEPVAEAIQEGYSPGNPRGGYHGYYFKVLKGQGPAARLGELDFVVGGAMIGGFALAAAPMQYGVTGVQTFIVSHDGLVYQKDFGPKTLDVFEKMDRFNPDSTWKVTKDALSPDD